MLKTIPTLLLAGIFILSACKKESIIYVPVKVIGTNDTIDNNNTTNHYIGEQFGGGIIYHLWKDNAKVEHGLIVTLKDQSKSQVWSNVAYTLIGSTAQHLGDGLQNSNAIINQPGHTNSAAKLCLDLELDGQSDWYLPSADEMAKLLQNRIDVNKVLGTINGAEIFLNTSHYWASNENSASDAWSYGFNPIWSSGGIPKSLLKHVRAIRSF